MRTADSFSEEGWCCELSEDVSNPKAASEDAPNTNSAAVAPVSPKSAASEDDLRTYSLLLRGALESGTVAPSDQTVLRKWASEHSIDDQAHTEALSELGMTKEGWVQATTKALPTEPTPEKESPHGELPVRTAGFLLALQAGFVNGLAMKGLYKIAVSHVTGTVTRTALGDGDMSTQSGVVLSFILGSTLCGLIIGKNQVNFGLALYGFALLGTSALLFVAAATAEESCSIYFAAAAMGMQNGMATTYSGAVVRTTHMTGCATDIGLLVGRILGRVVRGGTTEVVDLDDLRADTSKLVLLLLLLTGFAVGGILGAEGYSWLQEDALYLPAAASALMGTGYMLYRVGILRNKVFDSRERDELEITYDVIDQPAQETHLGRSASHIRRKVSIVPRATRRSGAGMMLDHESRRISAVLHSQFLEDPVVFGSAQQQRRTNSGIVAKDAVYAFKEELPGMQLGPKR